jgi:hypothetical protein
MGKLEVVEMSVRYVKNGNISVGKSYRYVVEITNLFGHSYNVWRRGGVVHGLDAGIEIWWPTISVDGYYKHWQNTFNADGTRLVEKADDQDQTQVLLEAVRTRGLFNGVEQRRTAYVFVRVLPRDSGDGRYCFKGVFEFNEAESNAETGLVWDKTATEVTSYRAVQP